MLLRENKIFLTFFETPKQTKAYVKCEGSF